MKINGKLFKTQKKYYQREKNIYSYIISKLILKIIIKNQIKFPSKQKLFKNLHEAINIKSFSSHIVLTPVKYAQPWSYRLKVPDLQLKH